jgi:hypothetical protein
MTLPNPTTSTADERSMADDVRSKDAVETAIDRSKDPRRTWESALPTPKDHRWTKPSAHDGYESRVSA